MHHSKIWQVTCRLIEVPRNDYLSDDTVLAADARRLSVKSYVTGGPAQAKLCCYDGWFRLGSGLNPAGRNKRLHYSANKLTCISKGINNASRK
jgi:hypothetical protein